jgi:hypothetical protein
VCFCRKADKNGAIVLNGHSDLYGVCHLVAIKVTQSKGANVKAVLLTTLLLATPAFASDGIATVGPLTDTEFLRLLTCGATPDGPCQRDAVKWGNPGELTLAFGPVPKGYNTAKANQISAAIDAAIASINAAGSAINLTRVDYTDSPQITLRPTLFYENDAVYDEPGVADGEQIGAGYVYVYWDDRLRMTEGTILIARDIYESEIDSIVLEEITQSLGFLFDIENPDYENVSIFAQDSNTVLSISGQDAAVMRLYYPN